MSNGFDFTAVRVMFHEAALIGISCFIHYFFNI